MKPAPNDLNEYAKYVHSINKKWWQDPATGKPIERNKGELLMLVITELAEAVEGIRKNLMDDKLPHRSMEEVEMADAMIRLLDFGVGFGVWFDDFIDHEFDPSTRKSEDLLDICRAVSVYFDSTDEHENTANISSYIMGYCTKHNLDLWSAVEEKLEFNKTREDHTHEARLKEGGKKF